MSHKSYREMSKTDWHPSDEVVRPETNDNIKLGCMLRIADACETMSLDRKKLEMRCAWLEQMDRLTTRELESVTRQRTALRGQVTKLKREIERLKGAATE